MSETPSPLTFITESLPDFNVGEPQQVDIEVSGGTPPYSFEITQGKLPESLTLSEDGTISGTVTKVVQYTTIGIDVTDANGYSLTQDFDVHVSKSKT